MAKILIFKTASEIVMQRILEDLSGDHEVFVLVQSSTITLYKAKYPEIKLIDIKRESFYDIPPSILNEVGNIIFDQVYIPLTSINAFRFGNIIEIVEKLNYKQAFFYNCYGEVSKIPPNRKFWDLVCKGYLGVMKLIKF